MYLSVSTAQCSDCTYYALYVDQQFEVGSGELDCINNPSQEDTVPCHTECGVSKSQDTREVYT